MFTELIVGKCPICGRDGAMQDISDAGNVEYRETNDYSNKVSVGNSEEGSDEAVVVGDTSCVVIRARLSGSRVIATDTKELRTILVYGKPYTTESTAQSLYIKGAIYDGLSLKLLSFTEEITTSFVPSASASFSWISLPLLHIFRTAINRPYYIVVSIGDYDTTETEILLLKIASSTGDMVGNKSITSEAVHFTPSFIPDTRWTNYVHSIYGSYGFYTADDFPGGRDGGAGIPLVYYDGQYMCSICKKELLDSDADEIKSERDRADTEFRERAGYEQL